MQIEVLVAKVVAAGADHLLPGAGAPVEVLVKDLLAVQDEQVLALQRIEGHVQSLVDGPWNTGRRYLQEAGLSGRTPEQTAASLAQAQSCFRQAADLQPGASLSRASVCLDLAMVCCLLGDRELAALYATESSRVAHDAVREYVTPATPGRRRAQKVARATQHGALVATFILFAPALYVVLPAMERLDDLRIKVESEREIRIGQFRAIERASVALGAPEGAV